MLFDTRARAAACFAGVDGWMFESRCFAPAPLLTTTTIARKTRIMAPLSSSVNGTTPNAAAAAAAAAAAENYQSFPVVAPEEAATLISNEIGVATMIDDILRPTPQFVLRVFCTFLELMSGTTMEWIERQRDSICGQLEYRVSVGRQAC